MNFIGHIHLAEITLTSLRDGCDPGRHGCDPGRHGSDPGRHGSDTGRHGCDPADLGYLIGSALPDIAAMGRFRLTERPADESVSAGIDLHHRTDEAFHRHPWFRRNSKAVSDHLASAGLPRGAARACGHVGVELLLDGRLLDRSPALRPSVQTALGGLALPGLGLSSAVDHAHRSAWTDHLDSVSSWTLPTDYRSPPAVARRLQRILARRPRLAFSADQVETVGLVLAERQPILEADIAELLDDLSDDLAA